MVDSVGSACLVVQASSSSPGRQAPAISWQFCSSCLHYQGEHGPPPPKETCASDFNATRLAKLCLVTLVPSTVSSVRLS